eukprot:gene30687-37080_t
MIIVILFLCSSLSRSSALQWADVIPVSGRSLSPRFLSQQLSRQLSDGVNDNIARFYSRDLIKSVPSVTSSLTVFVTDTSVEHVSATRGAVSSLLAENERVAVVACTDDKAGVKLAPTSSLMHGTRALVNWEKGDKRANLEAGLKLALLTAEEELERGASNVHLAVLIDAKSSGDEGGSGLKRALEEVRRKAALWGKRGRGLTTVLIDSPSSSDSEEEMTSEGVELAHLCNGNYYHAPDIDKDSLLRAIQNNSHKSSSTA